MDTESSKVLDFSLLQVTDVKNSNAMELEGLKRCLDHLKGENVKIAKIAQTKEGTMKFKFVSPKGSRGWVAKPQYEAKSYQFLHNLMADLLTFKRGLIEVPPLPPKPPALNNAPTPRPSKEMLIEGHRSRF